MNKKLLILSLLCVAQSAVTVGDDPAQPVVPSAIELLRVVAQSMGQARLQLPLPRPVVPLNQLGQVMAAKLDELTVLMDLLRARKHEMENNKA